jgi:hypothetical protein
MVYKGSNSPPRKVVQNGKFANDGTGDTLRDAADKINDNFAQLWYDLYNAAPVHPGREFTCVGVSDSLPDSGGFTMNYNDLAEDSDTLYLRFSAHDMNGKTYKFGSTTTMAPITLSVWEIDSADVDRFNLRGVVSGEVNYVDSAEYWKFRKTSVFATDGTLDSDGTYYFNLQGVW